jgi:hypothetical protein
MSTIEPIMHVCIEDREFNLYLSICYDSMTLHAYKYNDRSIEYDWFVNLEEFKSWVQNPIQS